MVDAVAIRLYRLVTRNAEGATGPSPVTLVVHDLLTSAGDGEIGRLDQPGVRAGWWETGQAAPRGDYPNMAHAEPGVALSPDGRRLAVAHADAEVVTLVDTESLTIRSTASLARPAGLLERLARFLSLMPREAAAKFAEGTTRWAHFGPDGRQLYVWGSEMAIEGEEVVVRELGLAVVDPERGTILAEGSHGEHILDVLPAPGGRTLYVTSYREPPDGGDGASAGATILRRLDARTLAMRAERAYAGDGWVQVVLLPGTGTE